MPIGAYLPVDIMKPVHVDPEEAVLIHKDVRAKTSVSIHFGTFSLTDEPLDEPPKRLATALAANGLSQSDFLVLDHGETVDLTAANHRHRHKATPLGDAMPVNLIAEAAS